MICPCQVLFYHSLQVVISSTFLFSPPPPDQIAINKIFFIIPLLSLFTPCGIKYIILLNELILSLPEVSKLDSLLDQVQLSGFTVGNMR